MRPPRLRAAVWSIGSWAVAACSSSTSPSHHVQVRAELVRIPGGGSILHGAGLRGGGRAELNRPWATMVDVGSFRAPVTQITLSGPTVNTTVLYLCSGATSDDCLVELNGPALQDLIPTDAVTVLPGTYNQVNIIYCKPPETGYHTFVTGSVALAGSTWFTRTSGNLGTTGPAQAVGMSEEGCGKAYPILPPMVVDDTISTTVPLRLYFDIRDIAYAALGDPTTNQGWTSQRACTPVVTLGVTPYVCDTYPDIAAVRGTVAPSEERYRINGGGTIALLFDPSGAYVGGFTRRYFVDGTDWYPGFFPDGSVDGFTPNGDGSYHLSQIHGSNFPAFRRESHSGTATDGEGHAFAYTAVRLP